MKDRLRVGLALGGGVVRGIAHVGVLSVLHEAHIPVDYIAGTSAGAIVGACYAAGMDLPGLCDFTDRFSWWRLLRPVWPVRGFFSFGGLRNLVTQALGEIDLADLKLPCVVAVTDVERAMPCYLSSGPLAPIVQASCSVPGFIAPVPLDGHLYGEGGVTDMLPAAVLRRMGAEYIIGVNIFQPRLWRFLGPFGYLLGAAEAALEHTGGGVTQVDCLIAPNLAGRSYLLFSHHELYYELGRQAALAKLPEILQALDMTEPAAALPN